MACGGTRKMIFASYTQGRNHSNLMSAPRFASFWSSYKASAIPAMFQTAGSTMGISGIFGIMQYINNNQPINYTQVGKFAGQGALIGAAVGVTYPVSVPAIFCWGGYGLYQYSKRVPPPPANTNPGCA